MRARRLLVGAASSIAAAVGLIGVLHMPFARGLLMRVGGCPVGQASFADVEPAWRESVKADRGKTPAPARPALGFALDTTTRADVEAWAERSHVSCRDQQKGIVFCYDVPATALGLADADGPVSEVHFGFGGRGVLIDLATMRMNSTAAPARDIETKLAAEVGAPPQQKTGSFDDAHLAQSGPLGLSKISYHYSDYEAEVIAMRFQSTGLVVREHYVSAND